MTDTNPILVVGSVDCNDGASTTLTAMTLGKPLRSASEYGGLGIDIAKVGAVDMSGLVESRFTVNVTAASVDAVSAIVASIAAEVRDLADITVGLAGSSYTGTLRVRIGECIEIPLTKPMDSALMNAHWTRIEIVVRREPYVYPANRVFLASPRGYDLPVSDDVVVLGSPTYDANLTCADAGRYSVASTTSLRGILELHGAAVPDETLVVEFDYELESTGATNGLKVYCTFSDVTGADSESSTLLTMTTVSRGHVVKCLRVPAGSVRFRLGVTPINVSAAARGYVWNVSVGEKQAACPVMPSVLPATSVTDLPRGWAHLSIAHATWTHDATTMILYAAGTAEAAYAYSLTNITSREGHLPVKPGRVYGCTVTSRVYRYVSGTFVINVAFLDAANVLCGDIQTVRVGATAVDAARVTSRVALTAPANAAKAYIIWGVSNAADLDAYILDAQLGSHVVEAPMAVYLDDMVGEHAAPLEIWGNVDVESDAHSVYYAVGRSDGSPFTFAAEALTWSGGATATTTSADDFPGTGDTGKKNTGITPATAPIDCAKVRPGTYELMVRARTSNVTYPGTLSCAQSSKSAAATLTTPQWLSLGQITLPVQRKQVGAADNITVSMAGTNAGAYVQVDRYQLLPVTQGGMARYHPAAATTVASQFDLIDGVPYVDGVADYVNVVGNKLLAASDDRLFVLAEKSASAETTHAVDVLPLYRPLYDGWQ